MPDTAPQVTVVTVAYNSFDVLPDMANSLPQGVPLVIVDNTPDARPAIRWIFGPKITDIR